VAIFQTHSRLLITQKVEQDPPNEVIAIRPKTWGNSLDWPFDPAFCFERTVICRSGLHSWFIAKAFLDKDPGANRLFLTPGLLNTKIMKDCRWWYPINDKDWTAWQKSACVPMDAVLWSEMSAHHYFRVCYCDSCIEILVVSGGTHLYLEKKLLSNLVNRTHRGFPSSGKSIVLWSDPAAAYQSGYSPSHGTEGLPWLIILMVSVSNWKMWRLSLRKSNTNRLFV